MSKTPDVDELLESAEDQDISEGALAEASDDDGGAESTAATGGEGGEGEGQERVAQTGAAGSAPAWPPQAGTQSGNRTALPSDPFPTLTDEKLAALAESTGEAEFRNVLNARQQARTLQQAAQLTAEAAQIAQLRTGFDMKAVQDFPALADSSSPLFKRTMAEIQALTAGGYNGPDVNFRAATMAAAALKVGPDTEGARNRRIDRSSSFERPQRRTTPKPSDGEVALGAQAQALADRYGITTEEGKRALQSSLKEAALAVKGRA